MNMWKQGISSVAVGLSMILASGIVEGAIAQEFELLDDEPIEFQTIPEAFERGITFSSQDAYSTTATFGRQLDFIFGFAGFPESEISRDGSIVNSIYDETMYRQYSLGPIIRTPDLASPFNSSLRTNPSLLGPTQTNPGSEYWFPSLR